MAAGGLRMKQGGDIQRAGPERGGILASRRESILGSATLVRKGALFEGVSHPCVI